MSEWSDSKSWLFINNDGHLRRIYCPFPVLCIADVKDIPRTTITIKKFFILNNIKLNNYLFDFPITKFQTLFLYSKLNYATRPINFCRFYKRLGIKRKKSLKI